MTKIQEMTKLAKTEANNSSGPSKFRTWYYGSYMSGTAWCAAFCSWLAAQCGLINKAFVKTDGAGCFAREGVPKGYGRWLAKGSTPKEGDLILYRYGGSYTDKYHSDHVGYVYNVDSNYVYTIEGNTLGSNNNWNDTSSVNYRKRSLWDSTIWGYYRPNYPNAPSSNTTTTTAAKPTVSAKGNNDIKAVQQWLNTNYGTHCTIDGEYGEQTKSALVGALQCYLNKHYNAGLVVDGVFGAKTKAAIRVLRKGAKGDYVYILQGLLICHGYSTNGFDGDFGSGTESAVKKFQASVKITVDGEAGKDTFSKLFAA